MPTTPVYVDSDGQGLHDPHGENVPGILVEDGNDAEYVPDEDPSDWGGRAVVPRREYEESTEPDATPEARKILDDAGIDVEDVHPGSGKQGRVLKSDAEEAVAASESEDDEDDGGSSAGGDETADDDDGPGALDFASDDAAEAFLESDVDPAKLAATDPSGEDDQYTVADVDAAREDGEG